MSRHLILTRHGESVGNLANVFTGWTDLDLTPRGRDQAMAVGEQLRALDIPVRHAFSSGLRRAQQSAEIVLSSLGRTDVEMTFDKALNERDYGELTGLDKDEARSRWGAEQVQIWRRSYDQAPPGGESLRDTVARVLPFFLRHVLPEVMREAATLIVAHGNSLRALIMALDGLTPTEIPTFELATGETVVYRLAADTTVERRETFRVA